MRVNQWSIVPGISAEQVDQANRSWDFLESHAIPGVVLWGLSIVHERNEKWIRTKRKSSKRNSIIVTLEFTKELPKPEIVSAAPSTTFTYQAPTALLTLPRPTWPRNSNPAPVSAPVADNVLYFCT